MEIKTKYNTGQEVWFIADNRIVKGDIVSVNVNANSKKTDINYSVSYFKTESNLVAISIKEQDLFVSRQSIIDKFCG